MEKQKARANWRLGGFKCWIERLSLGKKNIVNNKSITLLLKNVVAQTPRFDYD